MTKISAVIITFNEERNIGRCLESLQGVVDDIVVVDSYSTDKTQEISEKYGARFVLHPFDGHIQQKNWAITQAKYPHVLSLDADEALSEELKQSIIKVKENFKHDGYYFNRLTNYCGKWIRHTSWYPARKLRLWDSRKGEWGGVNPHDEFKMEKGSKKKYLRGDLLHYSYYTIDEHILQINKFSTIISRSYFNEGRRSNILKILFNPVWRFFRDYILKLGVLDGFYGFVVCINSGHETFLKYAKLQRLQKDKKKEAAEKICFFNTAPTWGGGEKWHIDIASRLKDKGHNVLLITSRNSQLSKRAKHEQLPLRYTRISNLSFLNFFKILYLAKVFKKEKIRTIIINLSADFKAAGIAANMAKVKNIIYRRGSAIAIKNTALNRYLYRDVATRLIANSKETVRTIFENNRDLVPEEKVSLVYNGIDLSLYNPDTKEASYKAEDGEFVIGNAARLSEEKGHVHLIELAAILKQKGYKFKLLLAGAGKLDRSLHKMVDEQGLTNCIKFLGFVEDIPAFIKSLDLFILTSHWEGFGYVLTEAMAMYKPVIAFDIRSSSEIIVDNETGYLIPQFDVKMMADRTETLIKDKSIGEKMGIAGHQRVEELFSIQYTLDELEKII